MDDEETLRHIHDALTQRGYEEYWGGAGRAYRRSFDFGNGPLGFSIEIGSRDFLCPPTIRLSDPVQSYVRVLPHVMGANRSLCYFDANSVVLDRYNPGGTIARCVERAYEVVRDAVAGKSDQDFAEEFSSYWGYSCYIDLPDSFLGDTATLYWLALDNSGKETAYVAVKSRVPAAFMMRHKRFSGHRAIVHEACSLIRIDAELTVDPRPGKWPPLNLAELTEWLSGFMSHPMEALKQVIKQGPNKRWFAILRARNGSFIARIDLPSIFDKTEFTETRRTGLPDNLFRIAEGVPVLRYAGRRIDRDYVFGRALHGMKGLERKKIMLIGCGTIGGFLAQHLAQSGAGTEEGGELCLVDKDTLGPQNLGRHLLGTPWLEANKAEACREFLLEQLPHVNIVAKAEEAMNMREKIFRYELVIDATGEEAFSIALNHEAVMRRPKSPPILFVWLLANGAATQAILSNDKDFACYKCLKPELGKPSRFAVVKSEPDPVRILACGDTTYAPFPVSRPAHAAALALDMALDWVNDHPRPYFRSRTLDERGVDFHPKDGNPARSPICPACRSV